MVTIFLGGGVVICALMPQAQLEWSYYQRDLQEPHNGNYQQLHYFPRIVRKVERNFLHSGHRLMEIGQSELPSFGRSKQPLWWWLHTFLLLQSCSICWVPHSIACVQGICVVWSSNGIQWSWGTYPLRGENEWLLVEWTCTLFEFRHSYVDFDRFNCYGSTFELRLCHYFVVQTKHTLRAIGATRTNGK